MPSHRARLSCASLVLTACATAAHPGTTDSQLPDGGDLESTTDAGARSRGASNTNAGAKVLTVEVEDIREMKVTVVAVACAGDCVEVEAVAEGGHPPYHYAWSDGSTDASREICPDRATRYEVEASDTAVDRQEFPYMALRASAAVEAKLLTCGDPPPPSAFCVENGSFEGKPGVSEYIGGFAASPWSSCDLGGSPDVWDEQQSWGGAPGGLAASAGKTYLEIYDVKSVFHLAETVGQPLCAGLVAGSRYSFELDLAFRTAGSFGGNALGGGLEVWAAKTACGKDQLLWTSARVSEDWETHCVTFVADQDFNYIQLRPVGDYLGTTAVFVDNLVPVESCGAPDEPL